MMKIFHNQLIFVDFCGNLTKILRLRKSCERKRGNAMAKIIQEPSRTFGEYLLIPNLTTKDCIVANVDLKRRWYALRKVRNRQFH